MFSDAEGIGNIRPVYSTDCARGIGCPLFVGPYRVGGGAGDNPHHELSRLPRTPLGAGLGAAFIADCPSRWQLVGSSWRAQPPPE
jgi:hypothetical protein